MGIAETIRTSFPEIELKDSGAETVTYLNDRSSGLGPVHDEVGPVVVFPVSARQVQDLVRLAVAEQVTVVTRGAGSGLSGGASATADQLVISTERLNRILEVSPLDQVAVVEPGVINADLNTHLEQYGLFYAPDPASYEISSIGGNIATNAGGLRCAKYGVTEESVLALDVVLADGRLISVGHRSIKGVTGLDLVSLFVGSEGILGIVVKATVRLRPLPVGRRTLTAYFDSTAAGAKALAAITLSPVQPSIVEFFDEPTLRNIDGFSKTRLLDGGNSLILIELDGYGLDEQVRDITGALERVGGVVNVEDEQRAEELWELRRKGRGPVRPQWVIGEDIAVPKSRLPEVYDYFPTLENDFGVAVSAVAHAGDGNLHPLVSRFIEESENPEVFPSDVEKAADELVRYAVSLGGTVSGEHGIGLVKKKWLGLELTPENLEIQHAIKKALDPGNLFNPGKAI